MQPTLAVPATPAPNPPPVTARDNTAEGLRGLAAVTVFLAHFSLSFFPRGFDRLYPGLSAMKKSRSRMPLEPIVPPTVPDGFLRRQFSVVTRRLRQIVSRRGGIPQLPRTPTVNPLPESLQVPGEKSTDEASGFLTFDKADSSHLAYFMMLVRLRS